MLPLVECVPNFSEGRDQRVIDAITDAIRFTPGADLLHVDIGPAANRTVCTFTGPPDAVATAALAAARVAVTRIDMRTHTGAHPRMGALDVCPFVPLQGVDMAQCVALARSVGAQLAADLGVPVYLYGEAAHRSHRRELATVRSGEYEGLPARMSAPARRPDLGPAEVHPWGASAVGARRILVAFNVNLNTTDVRIARRIAVLLRERGRGQHAGLLQGIRAIGWYIAPFGRCQVSMNLIDHQRTPPHAAIEVIRQLAAACGVLVTGSELVGLVPLSALRAAGRHYLHRQGRGPGAPDAELIAIASQSLGLSDVKPFSPSDHILEYRLQTPGPLVDGTVRALADAVSARHPTPGGGVVAALCAAMAASLTAMAGDLSGAPEAASAQAHKRALLDAVDEDAEAFGAVLAALRLPRRSAARPAALAAAMLRATRSPAQVLSRLPAVLSDLLAVVDGAPKAIADVGVAAEAASAAAEGAFYNVLANLPHLPAALATPIRARAEADRAACAASVALLRQAVRSALE